jgi:toxin secretion/phage lysis holin
MEMETCRDCLRQFALFSTKKEGEWAAALGFVCSIIASWFGGFDIGMIVLFVFMGIDYVTGMILAAVFKKSGKSESGALSSKAGWIGLMRKGLTLMVVIMAHCFDLLIGQGNYVRDGAVIAFVVNEAVSILENMGKMGVWVPSVLLKAIDILKERTEPDQGEKDGTDKG